MILTVTPNPSLDRTVEIPALTRGAVLRADAHRVDPGGKGVNVSRVLAAFSYDTVALMPGGAGELATLLRRAGIAPVSTPADGPTRVNTALVEPDGTTTKVNEPGPSLSADEVAALVEAVRVHAVASDWVVTAGSIPRGAPDDLHARIVAAARSGCVDGSTGPRVAVDTSGAALRAAVAARPDLIKPNVAELAELVSHPLPRLADVLAAAADLRTGGVGTVLVSMGAAGAVLVDDEGTWHAGGPTRTVRSTVGAGDSTLAGLLIARVRGEPPPAALVHAVACGAAAVGLPGTAVPGPADLDPTGITPTVPDSTLDSLDLTGEAA